MPDSNRRETGSRKLQAHPEIKQPDPTHTGDKGDEPKTPYGLTEAMEDRGDATRHHDGKRPATGRPKAGGKRAT